MKQHHVATIISYCTNDFRFLDMCIEQARYFSSQIIIVVSDCFVTGEPQDTELLKSSYERHPDCLFVEFAYDAHRSYGFHCPYQPGDEDWGHYWHGTGRYIGYHVLEDAIQSVLFLDVDEVCDGKGFLAWLNTFEYQDFDAIRFACYYYFREARHRALAWLPSALLMKREAIAPESLLDAWERQGILEVTAGKKMKQAVGLDGIPLIHHYSWVKTREEMLFKSSVWGHRHERDWAGLIEKEFSEPFRGVDCFYGLQYEEVEPWCDPLLVEPFPPPEGKTLDHVVKVDPKSFFRYRVTRLLGKE